MPKITEEFLRQRSSQILDNKAGKISIFNVNAENSFPRFRPSEILLGPILGKGGFCTVSEVKCVSYELTVEEKMRDLSIEDSQWVGLQNKTYITERFMRNGKARYAIKKVSPGCFQKGDPQLFVSSLIDLAMEVKFLAVLRHKNIIKMRALAAVPDISKDFFVVMDCLSATLDERIENLWKKQAVKKMLKKEQKIELLLERITVGYDICSALNFLHKNEIVYRDLKPENLGFDIRDDVKLFDFGLSAELQPAMKVPGSKPTTYNLTGETGSFRYMAPEVANSQPYNETADVYAFGILLAYICDLKIPFKGYDFSKMRSKVFNGKDRPSIGKACPDNVKEILPKMWNANISTRPSLDDVQSALERDILILSGGDISALDNTNATMKSL